MFILVVQEKLFMVVRDSDKSEISAAFWIDTKKMTAEKLIANKQTSSNKFLIPMTIQDMDIFIQNVKNSKYKPISKGTIKEPALSFRCPITRNSKENLLQQLYKIREKLDNYS